MTIKQKIFVKEYIDTKGNGVQSALKAYDTNKVNVANEIARENLQKPAIQSALADHEHLFKSVITNTVKDWANEDDTAKRTLATNTAKWGYEQIHGKAVQKSTSVNAHFYSHATEKRKQLGL